MLAEDASLDPRSTALRLGARSSARRGRGRGRHRHVEPDEVIPLDSERFLDFNPNRQKNNTRMSI